MTIAWQCELPCSQKMVLLALADASNDEGICWPSVASLCTKCGMSERTVQAHLNGLVEMGHIGRDERSGRSTIYRLNLRKSCAPADSAPPQDLHETPADSAPTPATFAENPRKSRTQNQKRTIKEPKANPKDALGVEELIGLGVDRQHATDWLTVRKAKRAGPLTRTALDGLAREAGLAGMSLDAAVKTCASRSWISLQAKWLAGNQNRHVGFEQLDYTKGVAADGRF